MTEQQHEHHQEKSGGLIQVYTGNGKGKSTAAFGLALRAAGCGMKVAIVQFMKKGEWYGEIQSFGLLPLVDIFSFGGDKFLHKGQQPDQQNLDMAAAALDKARQLMADPELDILILDELNNALYFDLISEEQGLELVRNKPEELELVITGRNAPDSLIELADLVTEMREIKHPYQNGVQARKGIEF